MTVYGNGTAPAAINNVRCSGGEGQLVDCSFESLDGFSNCVAFMGPAGAICRGQRMIKLIMQV